MRFSPWAFGPLLVVVFFYLLLTTITLLKAMGTSSGRIHRCSGVAFSLAAARLVRELPEHRIDASAPRAVEQLQLPLRGGLVGFHDFQHGFEEDGFVGAVVV